MQLAIGTNLAITDPSSNLNVPGQRYPVFVQVSLVVISEEQLLYEVFGNFANNLRLLSMLLKELNELNTTLEMLNATLKGSSSTPLLINTRLDTLNTSTTLETTNTKLEALATSSKTSHSDTLRQRLPVMVGVSEGKWSRWGI